MVGKVKSVIVTFDGTKYCYIEVDEEGKMELRKCCDEAKEVLTEGVRCTVNAYSDRPGFLMECEGVAECSEGRLVIRGT
ncbi:hypothetical protein IPA_03760 [Ignicoccus pacificus DSM 13166]|uniref:Uncharacterized protein n=1 Tax=Ignicoccus pacificus DSM 13166 TaxID=940294 RepID=A0A977PLC2_9CREN|nr:hypothetical protein IPA_03760 [Ignicoccus pacificus DSM 13166]